MTIEDSFRSAMRRLAGGVSLITTRDANGRPHGMAATSVVSVTADPPVLLVCINRGASMHGHVLASGRFCVNLLGEDHAALSQCFSNPLQRETRFADPIWGELATGAPVLESALAALDCQLQETVEAATHRIFLGRVAAIRLGVDISGPLAWFEGGYCKLVQAMTIDG